MLFNSFEFILFIVIEFVLFWFVARNSDNGQKMILLLGSCVFYMFFIPSYILILLATILVDYFAAIYMEKHEGRTKKIILIVSIISTCLILFIFKYFNFFIDNCNEVFALLGSDTHLDNWSIILPIGLSFHTFQSLSYVIEVYRGTQKAEKNFFLYSLYVMFFPQLVAGPIERPSNLLNQLKQKAVFNYELASDGMRLILWGLFKKVVIADNCAIAVDAIFGNYAGENGSTLVMGAFLFAFQIYGDFSGYTDMARGIAQLFGFKLMVNFSYPYFSRDIAEFWRRWHISLSSWFRDYVYIPLGGSKLGKAKQIRNTFIIFLLSGFWHGANWTFIIWGLLNALFILPLLLLNSNRRNIEIVALGKWLPGIKEFARVLFTFTLTCFAWIFFRADSASDAFGYLEGIFSSSLLSLPQMVNKPLLLLIALFVLTEWLQRGRLFGLDIKHLKPLPRYSICSIVFLAIFFFGVYPNNVFIYFQF